MLVEARESVKALLTARLADLHALAGALIEHETLTSADIDAVLRGEPLQKPQPAVVQPAGAPAPLEPELAAAATAAAEEGQHEDSRL